MQFFRKFLQAPMAPNLRQRCFSFDLGEISRLDSYDDLKAKLGQTERPKLNRTHSVDLGELGGYFESKIDSIEDDYFLYFAYGSNLLKERIHVSNPSATFVGTARLDRFGFGYHGFGERWRGAAATIFPRHDSHIYGVVWKIHKEHSHSLDAQEHTYNRVEVEAQLLETGQKISCRTYILTQEPPAGLDRPSPHYKTVIVTGAKRKNLPKDYIEFLESFEDNGYNGTVAVELEAIKHLNVPCELMLQENEE